MTTNTIDSESEPRLPTLSEKAAEWIADNPQAMEQFRRFAKQMGWRRKRFGFRLLAERVRWEFATDIELSEGEFKLNDHFTPYIARAIVQELPELAGLIECRVTKAADRPYRTPTRRPGVDPLTEEPLQ